MSIPPKIKLCHIHMSLNLLYHKISNFAKLFCVFFIIFSFSYLFLIKLHIYTIFDAFLAIILSYFNDFCVFFFVYNTQKSQSLFTEKTLGFHFYIKVIQFLRMFSFYSLIFAASFFFIQNF